MQDVHILLKMGRLGQCYSPTTELRRREGAAAQAKAVFESDAVLRAHLLRTAAVSPAPVARPAGHGYGAAGGAALHAVSGVQPEARSGRHMRARLGFGCGCG